MAKLRYRARIHFRQWLSDAWVTPKSYPGTLLSLLFFPTIHSFINLLLCINAGRVGRDIFSSVHWWLILSVLKVFILFFHDGS